MAVVSMRMGIPIMIPVPGLAAKAGIIGVWI
jgi:hypothetical protein